MAEAGSLPAIARRLSVAGEAVKAARSGYDADIVTRDRLILEALDEGHGWREVAEWAGVSQARVQQIIVSRAARDGAA